jgi:hypothetical protein
MILVRLQHAGPLTEEVSPYPSRAAISSLQPGRRPGSWSLQHADKAVHKAHNYSKGVEPQKGDDTLSQPLLHDSFGG